MTQTQSTEPRSRRLGEIVLRTRAPEAMVAFYREDMGLTVFQEFSTATFLAVSEDREGHPQILAIFHQDIPSNGPGEPTLEPPDVSRGPLHHFAFSLTREDFWRERERLAGLGHQLREATHLPMAWRSLYLYDPDGNTVELVCHDPSLSRD